MLHQTVTLNMVYKQLNALPVTGTSPSSSNMLKIKKCWIPYADYDV